MSIKAIMPMSDYVAICDAIKEKTGADDNRIKSGELPNKIAEVYEAGEAQGEQAGRQAQESEFWDIFQDNGEQVSYTAAFRAGGWTNKTYAPKYDFVPQYCNQMFTDNTRITDTKVAIDISKAESAQYLFQRATAMVTIRSLKVKASQTYTNFFQDCKKLKNITFDGEIGRSISFADSPLLTVESMVSVIDHLVNYAGTTNEDKYSVTFPTNCWEALNADGGAPEGMTWQEYVVSLGWIAN